MSKRRRLEHYVFFCTSKNNRNNGYWKRSFNVVKIKGDQNGKRVEFVLRIDGKLHEPTIKSVKVSQMK